jgi:excisionase family DNA binding protein
VTPVSLERFLTPPEVARRYGVSAEKVIGWIRRGELRAINLAARRGRRPRWRIGQADLLAFENRRAAIPEAPQPRRRRTPDDVIQYF